MIYTVSQLTGLLKAAIEDAFPFVWVRGQVSNLARPGSGHLYFTLKDADACLNVVWFKGKQQRGAGFDPLTGEVFDKTPPGADPDRAAATLADGQEVLCGGKLTVYPPRGAYQLVADFVQDAGVGRLHLQFEALKQKYAALGYFGAERKRTLPRHPRRVAVITAPRSAALRDFARIAADRGLPAAIRIYPVLVQGDEAPAQIATALDLVNAHEWAEVAVLIRGGGSLEDLWAFNTEPVAEAVFRSRVPVLAGVGHEVDVSLADMIADLRAATPTHAAQLLWPERRELAQSVDGYEIELYKWRERYFSALELRVRGLEKGLTWLAPGQRLERMLDRVASAAQRLERGLETVFTRRSELVERNAERLARAFGPREVKRAAQGVEGLAERLSLALNARLAERAGRLDGAALRLHSLDPEAPLRRGYSLVTARKSGRRLRSVAGVVAGDVVDIRLQDGRVESQALATFPDSKQ